MAKKFGVLLTGVGSVRGSICMPLQKNVPNGHDGWTLTTCPKCGAACGRRPEQELLEKSGCDALCTNCALTKGRK